MSRGGEQSLRLLFAQRIHYLDTAVKRFHFDRRSERFTSGVVVRMLCRVGQVSHGKLKRLAKVFQGRDTCVSTVQRQTTSDIAVVAYILSSRQLRFDALKIFRRKNETDVLQPLFQCLSTAAAAVLVVVGFAFGVCTCEARVEKDVDEFLRLCREQVLYFGPGHVSLVRGSGKRKCRCVLAFVAVSERHGRTKRLRIAGVRVCGEVVLHRGVAIRLGLCHGTGVSQGILDFSPGHTGTLLSLIGTITLIDGLVVSVEGQGAFQKRHFSVAQRRVTERQHVRQLRPRDRCVFDCTGHHL